MNDKINPEELPPPWDARYTPGKALEVVNIRIFLYPDEDIITAVTRKLNRIGEEIVSFREQIHDQVAKNKAPFGARGTDEHRVQFEWYVEALKNERDDARLEKD